ncbi:ParA family protein [Piscinibacter aquaticus]|uniref:ParA family protein n=1 Tax=Piscinibacter aquaticus TaxID=392597 RepID=A0A5C6U6G7_9BURK|nr:ParA family protein [Piscinibacter aquaticus]
MPRRGARWSNPATRAPMPVIAVLNRKGGSGKSTLATHLAALVRRHRALDHAGRRRLPGFRGGLAQAAQRAPGGAGTGDRRMVGRSAPRDAAAGRRHPRGARYAGGLRGLDLAKVVMTADALLIPVCHSVFDRESATDCVAELRQLPRVASGRCRIGVVGMRIDARTRGESVLRAWAEEQGLPFVGALRETQAYVRCAEQGLTIFDMPPAKTQADVDQWQPILDWLRPVMALPATRAQPDEPEAMAAHTARRESPNRPRFSPSTAQVPLDVLERHDPASPWWRRLTGWFSPAPSRRRQLRDV